MKPVSDGHYRGVAVDIDDTLALTAQTCMQLMKQKFGSRHSVRYLLTNFGQPGQVPEWQHNAAQEWLQKTVSSEDFLVALTPVTGAKETLTVLAKTQPVQYYITSRLDSLKMVTQTWLDTHGFPKAPVVTRAPNIHAHDWKLRYLAHQPNNFLYTFIDDDRAAFNSPFSLYVLNPVLFSTYRPITLDSPPVPSRLQTAVGWSEVLRLLTK